MTSAETYVRTHSEELLGGLMRFLRQPCISAQGVGIEESVELCESLVRELGATPRRLGKEGSPPVVYTEVRGRSERSLLFYNHYDVQPPDPASEWVSPPFSPEVREGRVYGRGVADNRGDLYARAMAIRSLLDLQGKLPVTVKLFWEGEEEIGSPHLQECIRAHQEMLKADGCLWETGERTLSGRLALTLGVKGVVTMELVARGAGTDLHSSLAGLVPNPAWRLVMALGSIADEKQNIKVAGFRDKIRAPAGKTQLASLPFEEREMKERWRIDRFVAGESGLRALSRHLLEPTCTINGLTAGYQGEGMKTVLPNRASAKLDFRLVPDQSPDELAALVRAHLDRNGFRDVEMRVLAKLKPARTEQDSLICRAAVRAAKDAYGTEPAVYPTTVGSGPMWLFTEELGIPTVGAGIGHPESQVHGPNESVFAEDFLHGIVFVASLMENFSRELPDNPGGTNPWKRY